MKRILAVVLCLVMVFSLGISAFAEEPVQLRFMMWGGYPNGADFQSILLEAAPELEGKVEVETDIAGAQGGEMLSKLRLEIAAGNCPDIVQLNASMVPEFAAEGLLADLSEIFEAHKDNIMEGAWNVSLYDGKNVGVPFQLNSRIWMYRKDLFDAAGIDANAIKTTEDFIEAGKKLHEMFPDTYITNLGTACQGYNLGLIFSGNGASFTDEDGNYIVNTNEGVRAAFEAYGKIVESGVVNRINEWTPDWEQGFNNGTIASCLTGSWMTHFLNNYIDESHQGKWAIAQFPALGGAETGSEDGGAVYVVMNDSKNKEAAIEVIEKLMLTDNGQMTMFREMNDIPWFKSLADNEELNAPDIYWGDYMPEMLKSVEKISVFNFSPAYSAEIGIVLEYFDKYVNGELTLDEALDGAQNDLDSQIGNPYM